MHRVWFDHADASVEPELAMRRRVEVVNKVAIVKWEREACQWERKVFHPLIQEPYKCIHVYI